VGSKRVVDIRVLPGEPTDGSGRVCVHLFVQDERGLIVEPHALHPVFKDGEQVKQKVQAKPTHGRLACDPKRGVAPITHRGLTLVTPRTDDPRAVTCVKCKASTDYADAMIRIAQAEQHNSVKG
jgi:hypothetical protein